VGPDLVKAARFELAGHLGRADLFYRLQLFVWHYRPNVKSSLLQLLPPHPCGCRGESGRNGGRHQPEIHCRAFASGRARRWGDRQNPAPMHEARRATQRTSASLSGASQPQCSRLALEQCRPARLGTCLQPCTPPSSGKARRFPPTLKVSRRVSPCRAGRYPARWAPHGRARGTTTARPSPVRSKLLIKQAVTWANANVNAFWRFGLSGVKSASLPILSIAQPSMPTLDLSTNRRRLVLSSIIAWWPIVAPRSPKAACGSYPHRQTAIFGFGGLDWGLLLIAFFVSSSLLTALPRSCQGAGGRPVRQGRPHATCGRPLANGGLAALIALVYGLTRTGKHAALVCIRWCDGGSQCRYMGDRAGHLEQRGARNDHDAQAGGRRDFGGSHVGWHRSHRSRLSASARGRPRQRGHRSSIAAVLAHSGQPAKQRRQPADQHRACQRRTGAIPRDSSRSPRRPPACAS